MIVVDASVAIKWIQQEENTDKARLLQQQHLLKVNEIIVPQLLFYEIANTLVTKSQISEKYIKLALDIIYDSDLIVAKEERKDIKEASLLARKFSTTAYDMLYAVIAKKNKTVLITADERFAKITKFPFIVLLSEYSMG